MKIYFKNLFFIFLIIFLFIPALTLAHQPRITENIETIVTDPEISKAYYGKFDGEQHVYLISATEPFDLYVNVLVPDIVGQKKDVSAVIFKDGSEIKKLDGVNFEWKKFFEPFGHDTYWMGPEYKARADAGQYEIHVSSVSNSGNYSLAVGEVESFDFKESMNALRLIPKIKRIFFNELPVDFILSPFGAGLIFVMFLLSFIFGFIYRTLLKKIAGKTPHGKSKNIGKSDRLFRAVLGFILFVLAITTSWNPLLFFASGFCFFEAIFSWCGVYAAMGKNTCPINL
jgi:hypothetical protein